MSQFAKFCDWTDGHDVVGPLCFELVNSIIELKKSRFHYNVSVLNQKGTNVNI